MIMSGIVVADVKDRVSTEHNVIVISTLVTRSKVIRLAIECH